MLSFNRKEDLKTDSQISNQLNLTFFVCQSFLSLVIGINSSSITMIVFYLSELTCEQIVKLISGINKNEMDLGSLFNEMINIKMNVVTMNKAISFGLFVKFIDSGLSMSSLGCLLALTLQQEDFNNLQSLYRIGGIICMISYEFFECAIIFHSSAKLHKKCQDLNQEVETLISDKEVSPEQLNQAIIIYKVNQGIYFHAVFFDIKNGTFLTMLSQIISYIVILIQTEI